jgi:hypothetical protein
MRNACAVYGEKSQEKHLPEELRKRNRSEEKGCEDQGEEF